MRRLFRWLARLILMVVLVVIVAVLFRNPIVRELAERQIRQETGMEPVVGRIRIAVQSASVRIDNVRLMNPPEYGGQLFADLPDIYIEYDPVSLVFGRLRFERVLFRLDELRVIRHPEGSTNLDALLARIENGAWEERLRQRGFTFQGADTVGFSIGRFKYFDGHDPSRHEETYIGVRGVMINNPRGLEDILQTMGRLARDKGAPNTAAALFGLDPARLAL